MNPNPYIFTGGGIIPTNLVQQPQRLSQSKGYVRPTKTIQDNLSNEDIKSKLKNYIVVNDINTVPLGTHVRYYTKLKNGEIKFRLGGVLVKRDIDKPYVILSNGTLSWSAQKKTSKFYKKLTEEEEKEKLYDSVRKMRDKFTEEIVDKDSEIEQNRTEISKLKSRLDRYKNN